MNRNDSDPRLYLVIIVNHYLFFYNKNRWNYTISTYFYNITNFYQQTNTYILTYGICPALLP